jgi:hypothetical protein
LALLLGSLCSPPRIAAQQDPSDAPVFPEERPYLGALLCDVTAEEASPFNPQATEGALLWKLSADSPAIRAGLKAGDVIRMANSKEIKDAGQFIEMFSSLKSGDRLDLSIQRGRELRSISMVLAPLGPPLIPSPPKEPPVIQPSPPEGLKFSSNAESISYEHPERLFQLQLPEGWAVHSGHRGKLVDDRFDTLLDRSGQFQVIIWRQSFEGAEEGQLHERLFNFFNRGGLDYPIVASGDAAEGADWVHLAVIHPETGHQVLYSTVATAGRLLRFEFVSLAQLPNDELPEELRTVRAAIHFTKQTGPKPDTPREPPLQKLPKDLLRLSNIFDGKSRSLDLELVSGGSPEAIEMAIESPAGAAVTSVRPRTTAAAAGLRRGDLIVQLKEREINTPEDVEAIFFSSPIDQLIPLTYVRGDQRVATMLKVAAGEANRSALGEYRHPTGDYGFRYLPTWRLHPDARREEGTKRVYDYLTSRGLNVKLYLFHDQTAAPDPVASLQTYLEQTSQSFLEGYSGWLLAGEIPIVFASGVVGRDELQTLYRIAFVVNGQRYEVNAFTSPLYDPAQLPVVLTSILGSLEFPK